MPEGTSSATATRITSILYLAMIFPIAFMPQASNVQAAGWGTALPPVCQSAASMLSVLMRNWVTPVLPSGSPE